MPLPHVVLLDHMEMTDISSIPHISVCIPVFQSEQYLEDCLRSVFLQDFDSFEIIVVSDASDGRDNKGRSAKKIVKSVTKECGRLRKKQGLMTVPVRFIEHRENRGLVEARRTAFYESHGEYITQVDSDDQLEEGALKTMYEAAVSFGADMVHGTSVAGTFAPDGTFTPAQKNIRNAIVYGQLSGHDIFHSWIVDSKIVSTSWAKLIHRSLYQKAYDIIPYTGCNMAEDLLLFFFISLNASCYVGLEDKVYRYRLHSGMSSDRKIDNLQKWKMICSTASVFTVLSEWVKENPTAIFPDELEKLKGMTRFYLKNNLEQLHDTVIPDLQPAAHQLLCDFWGEDFVNSLKIPPSML